MPVVVAIALLLLVRFCLVTHYAVRIDSPELGIQAGDRLLVAKYAFRGLRRGTIVAFRHPRTSQLELARIIALPGDSVWVDSQQKKVFHLKRSNAEVSLIVPGRCEPVDVQPQSAALLCYVLQRYEATRAVLTHSNRVQIGGVTITRLHFSQNYYWLDGIGLIPETCIVGPVLCITYSSLNWSPRWNRFLHAL